MLNWCYSLLFFFFKNMAVSWGIFFKKCMYNKFTSSKMKSRYLNLTLFICISLQCPKKDANKIKCILLQNYKLMLTT